MNLAKALKTKNRLVGEISRLQDVFKRENSLRVNRVRGVDLEKIDTELAGKIAQLIELKTKIAKANVPIVEKIYTLAEHKSNISFLKELSTTDGLIPASRGGLYGGESGDLKYEEWTAYLKVTDVDVRVKAIQSYIDQLQDEIDTFNAVTEIE